jgi:outer membrane protein OmpA-like peptidoglycan-associated protein
MMKKINIVLCYGLALILIGCASAKKAELTSGSDPKAAITEVTRIMQRAEDRQSDLLSPKLYGQGTDYLNRTKRGLSAGHKNEQILENAAISKAFFQDALLDSGVKSSNAPRILYARKAALNAGLRNSDSLQVEMADLDDDLRDDTDEFTSVLKPEEFADFQKKYFSLEVKAVQFRELDNVRNAIKNAASKNAQDVAPNSLNSAMIDLKEAENFIAQSPRNPDIHKKSVDIAKESSVLLLDVMDVILNARGTPENIALKIVNQNRALGVLSKNVGLLEESLKTTQSNLATTQSSLMETEGTLKTQQQELEKSSTQIKFQQAMEQAGEYFSEEEASVYQQGNKLIFRLKKINFASGTSTIPNTSKPLLSKVNEIIKPLGAEMVVVQGHTDSVGATELNKSLSKKRASSVATYLASFAGGYKIGYIGYGEDRPIASNETKEGRAINRRVDLVVTAKK